MLRPEKIDGYPSEPFEGSFKPEPTSGSIRIKNATGDGKAITYTWKDFTFDTGKITGWTGKRGPVGSVLWTRTTSDKSRGRKAVLKSAYLANSGFLNVVVELSSSTGTGWEDAEYAAKDRYRQTSSEGAQVTSPRGREDAVLLLVRRQQIRWGAAHPALRQRRQQLRRLGPETEGQLSS